MRINFWELGGLTEVATSTYRSTSFITFGICYCVKNHGEAWVDGPQIG